jgi:hypothetical protein
VAAGDAAQAFDKEDVTRLGVACARHREKNDVYFFRRFFIFFILYAFTRGQENVVRGSNASPMASMSWKLPFYAELDQPLSAQKCLIDFFSHDQQRGDPNSLIFVYAYKLDLEAMDGSIRVQARCGPARSGFAGHLRPIRRGLVPHRPRIVAKAIPTERNLDDTLGVDSLLERDRK